MFVWFVETSVEFLVERNASNPLTIFPRPQLLDLSDFPGLRDFLLVGSVT